MRKRIKSWNIVFSMVLGFWNPLVYLQMRNKPFENNPFFYFLGFSLHEHRPFTKAFFLMMIQIEKEQVKVM